MLELSAITAHYGKNQVLRSIDLKVAAGEVVALIGANAAGKSTTMRLIAGLKRATSGSLRLDGTEIESLSTPKRVGLGIALVPEGRQVFAQSTVLENLTMGAYHRPDRNHIQPDIDAMFAMFPRLGERRNQRAGSMSGGEQQMVAIARGLMAKPKCLLLDEPTLGLAPVIVEEISLTVMKLARDGMTILLAEQNAAMALDVASRAYVLAAGAISAEGTPEAAEGVADRRAIVFRRGALGADPCLTSARITSERSPHVKSPAARSGRDPDHRPFEPAQRARHRTDAGVQRCLRRTRPRRRRRRDRGFGDRARLLRRQRSEGTGDDGHRADVRARGRDGADRARHRFLEKPVIAAVSGFALGGGVGLAVGCDLIVTHPECRWHMPEVPNGWLPPWALASLSARVGPVTARRLVWASEPITGTEAYELKLADYLVPQADVENEAIAVAERLAALPRVAVASTKRFFAPLINGSAEASDMLANRIFAENCQDDASKATLRKFGMKV